MRVLALGNLNLISDSMQACEQMMLRGDAQFLLCHTTGTRAAGSRPASSRASWSAPTRWCRSARLAGNGVPRWRLDGGEPVKYLAYSAQSGLGRIVAARWEAKDRAFALETVFTSHLAATLLSMARAGDGVAWLPRTLAEDDIAAGLLVEAGNPDLEIPIDIRLFALWRVRAGPSKHLVGFRKDRDGWFTGMRTVIAEYRNTLSRHPPRRRGSIFQRRLSVER